MHLNTAGAGLGYKGQFSAAAFREYRMEMDKWTFGLTLMIVGMGGTFLTVWVLSLVITLLKKIYPLKSDAGEKKNA